MFEPLMYRAYVLQDAAKPATDAAAPPGAVQQQPGGIGAMLVPMVIIFVLFWFIMIRPQRKQQVAREKMLGELKKNDHVMTTGGIYGIIARIDGNEVTLKIDEKNDVRIRVTRAAIAGLETAAPTPSPDAGVEQDAQARK